MAALTQTEVDTLVQSLNYYKFLVSAGEDSLGPLDSPPQIEADVETKDTTLYETGDEAQASIISKNNVKVTIVTRTVEKAMALLSAFKKGDNVIASDNAKVLTLVPITEDTTAKSIRFPRAFLQPGLSGSLSESDDAPSNFSLVYVCKPVMEGANAGKPFEYVAGQ